jgi:predicted HNH restriction endonuclease
MGQGFISSWLQAGDLVLIGNVGSQLFAAKLSSAPKSEGVAASELVNRLNRKNIFDRARSAAGKPTKKVVQRNDFVRNPFVVAAAIMRSKGKCEMPSCTCALFHRDDGSPYLEVHHIVPLAEGGDDTLVNAAALCPHCHRKLHHGATRLSERSALQKHIASSPNT